jgi:probable O-glycosylation ligase (exosortase A-associated)
MRDLAIVGVLPLLIYFSFKRPFIGLSLWLWTSAININQIVYGFAMSITFAKLFAGVAILSFLFSKEKSTLKIETLSILIILFYIIATLSNIGAIANSDLSWEKWGLFSKIILFYFFANAIINKKLHFQLICWILIISIGAMSAKEGVKFLISGGSHRIGELAGISGDNNFFGVMIVTTIPLAGFLLTEVKTKIMRFGVLSVIFFMILGIFSTFSRGGFVGLSIFAISFWRSSHNKFLWAIGLGAIVFALGHLMPDTWLDRMNTVENANEDHSFLQRVTAWKIGALVAMDHILGGGFSCVENKFTWVEYADQFYKLDFVPPYEIPAYEMGRFHGTHSTYFQILSNHGFIGFFLFLMILMTAFHKLSRIIKLVDKKNEDFYWISTLAKMMKLSLISYCISGALVNVAYFDFLYAIFAMIVKLEYQADQLKLNVAKNN